MSTACQIGCRRSISIRVSAEPLTWRFCSTYCRSFTSRMFRSLLTSAVKRRIRITTRIPSVSPSLIAWKARRNRQRCRRSNTTGNRAVCLLLPNIRYGRISIPVLQTKIGLTLTLSSKTKRNQRQWATTCATAMSPLPPFSRSRSPLKNGLSWR